jgi:uncharacterized membrane protein
VLDAFWDLAYASLVAFLAYALYFGMLDAIRSGETTMQRQIPIWPSIALSFALCLMLAATAFVTAIRLYRHSAREPA